MYKLAVVGNPIAHSLSPLIWQTFAKEVGVEIEYNKIHTEIDVFEDVIKKFFNDGGTSISITAPFKARAFAMANKHKKHTLGSQTANFLFMTDGQLTADNTDGVGLVDDFRYKCIDLTSKNILIIGSGSVVHSVLSSLEENHPAKIDLLMRNWDNLAQFENRSPIVDKYSEDICYDVIINTTPSTLENELFAKVKLISDNAIAYDMIYTAKQTEFLRVMELLNPYVTQANGVGMLIQQAKIAFSQVFGVIPKTEHLYPLLQAQFK